MTQLLESLIGFRVKISNLLHFHYEAANSNNKTTEYHLHVHGPINAPINIGGQLKKVQDKKMRFLKHKK